MDDATRARLNVVAANFRDVNTILRAYDALLAAQAQATTAYNRLNGEYLWLMDRATRVEQTALAAEQEVERLRALPSPLDRAMIQENARLRGELEAAEAALAQAAPVLAAAEAYVDYGLRHPLLVGCGGGKSHWEVLNATVLAWRAAREG